MMAISTWAIVVENKNVLNKLIEMVQKQELEEIFLCQIDKDGAVMQQLKKGNVIAVISTKGTTLNSTLTNLGSSVLLDDLADDMFEIDDDGASLKGVIYPESEEDELQMIQQL